MHVWGDADDRLVDVAVAEATVSVQGAVFDLVPRLQLEAFVTECWVSDGGPFVRVVERDVILVRGTLSSSDGGHATTVGRGTCGRLQVYVMKDASGEPRVDETTTCLEQGIVVHSDVLFQGLESCAERGAPSGLGAEPYNFCCDPRVVDGVDVFIHEFFKAGVGVQDVKVVVPYQLVVAQIGTCICATCVQRFAVNGGLLAVATFQNCFFAVEHVANEKGRTGHVPFRDVDAVMFRVVAIVAHPTRPWVDAVIFFVRVFVRRCEVYWGVLIPFTA